MNTEIQKRTIIIGTRGSQLALWQAHYTQTQLERIGHQVKLQIIKTTGDKIQNVSFNKIEGKGFFTKELEEALLNEDIDMAVHSYKDLPTTQPDGLSIIANSYRENPADWLIINKNSTERKFLSLKEGATVGTSSPRRASQLLHFRPDLKIKAIRGNVPTRVKKADEEVDAVVLAAAGLNRLDLDLSNYIVVKLPPILFIPAPAQGVLAFQIREKDQELARILSQIHDEYTAQSIYVERSILNKLEGGCQQPIGIYCKKDEETYHLWATYGTTNPTTENQEEKEVHDFKIKRIYLNDENPSILINQAVELLKQPTSKRVFITRDLDKATFFKTNLTKQGHQVFGESLIEFSPVAFNETPVTDWLFFSSRRGVQYFFEQSPTLSENIQVAAIGQGTALALKKYQQDIHFIGEHTDLQQVANEFEKLAANQKVLFPMAQNSLQHIQKLLEGKVQVQNLVVYGNQPKRNFNLPEVDVVVFTSPLNVKTYLNQQALSSHQTIVAIGASTAKALEEAGYTDIRLPFSFNELSLADVCY